MTIEDYVNVGRANSGKIKLKRAVTLPNDKTPDSENRFGTNTSENEKSSEVGKSSSDQYISSDRSTRPFDKIYTNKGTKSDYLIDGSSFLLNSRPITDKRGDIIKDTKFKYNNSRFSSYLNHIEEEAKQITDRSAYGNKSNFFIDTNLLVAKDKKNTSKQDWNAHWAKLRRFFNAPSKIENLEQDIQIYISGPVFNEYSNPHNNVTSEDEGLRKYNHQDLQGNDLDLLKYKCLENMMEGNNKENQQLLGEVKGACAITNPSDKEQIKIALIDYCTQLAEEKAKPEIIAKKKDTYNLPIDSSTVAFAIYTMTKQGKSDETRIYTGDGDLELIAKYSMMSIDSLSRHMDGKKYSTEKKLLGEIKNELSGKHLYIFDKSTVYNRPNKDRQITHYTKSADELKKVEGRAVAKIYA